MRHIGVAIAVAFCEVLAAAAATQGPGRVHTGMCDASAGVAFSTEPTIFFVANDEDQGEVVIRTYNLNSPPGSSAPINESHVSALFLELEKKHQEVDIEGAARIGDLIYWIGSHSTNKDGEARPNRRRLFATREVTGGHGGVQAAGKPYRDLIQDLGKDDRYKKFHLGEAGEIAPKKPGGLSIEGLAATPDGALLIGFRNPIPDAKALLVTLKNPGEVIKGEPAQFGDPILLDLGGLGIRSIERVSPERYLIIAGSHGEGGISRLFRWTGAPGAPAQGGQPIGGQGFNPEALFVSNDQIVVLSDDGSQTFPGHDMECKDLDDPGQKKFRSLIIAAP
jgi:Protein of unknown function (DUF3616)